MLVHSMSDMRNLCSSAETDGMAVAGELLDRCMSLKGDLLLPDRQEGQVSGSNFLHHALLEKMNQNEVARYFGSTPSTIQCPA